LHLLSNLVVGSYLEGKNFNTIQHALVVYKELLAVPYIIAVLCLVFWVLATSWVTAGDEVGNTASYAGAGVPEDFGGSTVVHGAGPDCENNVLAGKGAVVDQSLVLVNTGSKRNIVVLAPATEGVKEEDWVLETLFNELFTGVL
jgi:hypothetical protein